ncbi:hypothetical protein AAMO2058_001611800 [Amorphochlora amoebiformis]
MGVVSQPFSHALMSPGSHKLFRNVTHPPVPLTPMVNGWAVKARLYSCPCSSLLLVLTQLVIILVFIGHQRSLTYQRGKNEELSVLEANPSDGSEREAITDRFHAHFLSAREDGRRNPYREEEGEGEGRADYSKRGVGKDGDMTVENAITSRHTSRPTRLRKTTSFTPTENQTQNTPANPTTSRHEIVAFNGTANQTRNTPKKATASSSRRTIRRTIRRTNKSTAVNPTANQTQNTPANSTTTRRRKREFTPAANQTIKTAKNPTTSRSTSRRKREVQKTEFNPSAYKHNKTAEYPTTKQGKKAAFKPSSNERNHTDVYEIDIAARRAGINRSSTLHIAFGSLFSYMYSPFIETLVSGAESIGISYLIHGIGTDISFHLGQLRKVGEIGYARMYGLKSAIDDPNSPLYFLNQTKRGDVLVWIGVLAKQGEVPWRVLQKRGLYTAKYQLEPATRSPRSVCTEDIGIREADEMWDYSMSNIRHIKAHCPPKSATFRHIPAGYQHNSPKVKQKLHGPQHNKFNQTGKVYFLGNLHYGDRRECLYDIRKSRYTHPNPNPNPNPDPNPNLTVTLTLIFFKPHE